MQCPKCQTENRKGAKFCGECGHKFEVTCPECGTNNRAGNKFCDECGCDLRKPDEALPIDYSKPQSYTPKFLADKILTTRSSIEGERKLVTVLFADDANFTSSKQKLPVQFQNPDLGVPPHFFTSCYRSTLSIYT